MFSQFSPFQCSPFQYSPTLLADHMPFMIETNHGMRIISANMMKQMKFSGHFFNNGFNCADESDEFYTSRLCHQAAQLNIGRKQYTPEFICLQECPEEAEQYSDFIKSIELPYFFQHMNNQIRNLTTLYDFTQHYLDTYLTEKINLQPLSGGLANCILPLVFRNYLSNETTLVVNVHANFELDIIYDVYALDQCANILGINNTLFVGDFNRDLVLHSDEYSKHDISSALNDRRLLYETLHVHAIPGNTFCSTFARNQTMQQQLETRDGVISTEPVSVTNLMELGMANTALSFTKKLSPALKVMPDNFLSCLQDFNKFCWHHATTKCLK